MHRLGVEPGRRNASVGLLLAGAAVLATLCAGGWWSNTKAAANRLLPEIPQASAAPDEWEHRIFLPLVTRTRPLQRERYGFVAVSANWRQSFDVAQLGAGWYVDASPPSCAASPEGMDRALLLRVGDWNSVQIPWLESMVDNHPGSLWLVGNEPDCIWQDNVLPETYADIYHEIYTSIKTRDPTALVSPGGIVQPTPLRLQWLDRVLQGYETTHGVQMPVDVWNIHNAILRELSHLCDPTRSWGADIPPGFDECQGAWREVQDNDDIDIFKKQIWDFRQWMADRDYAGHPLIVTEFGVLMPVEFGFDADRVNAFMDATFEFFRSTTSNELGDPADGYRLVQRWAWFSLDNPPYDPAVEQTFNGNLFDPDTTAITGYGRNYAAHTTSLPPLDYVELRPGGLRFEPLEPLGPGEMVNRTVEIEVQNLGSQDSGVFVVRLEYDGPANGQLQRPVTNLAAGSGAWIAFELVQLSQGAYDVSVWVDPDNQVSETTECDNLLASAMVVPADVVYLPLIACKR